MNTNRPETWLDFAARLVKGAVCASFHREYHRRTDVINRRAYSLCIWECLKCGHKWPQTIRWGFRW